MSLQFISVIRQGLSTRLPVADSGATSPGLHNKPLAEALAVRARATIGTVAGAPVTMQLFGPHDVAGIDPHQLVRRSDPPPGAQSFDTSLFVQIEFEHPALPWIHTPLAQSGGRLRPWIALVVLERTSPNAPVDLAPVQDDRLAVLTVADAADLPPIDETWAWAHGQVALDDSTPAAPADLAALIAQPSRAALSRLICPRRLDEGKHYVACVVPTFEAARTAGLGETPDTTINPAWGPGAQFPLQLPVYHHWDFFTAEADNFEQAVRRLRRAHAPARAGRVIDASHPGRTAVEDPAADALPLAGALRPAALSIAPYTGPAVAGYERLARTGEVVTSPGGQTYPVVNVPLYAGKHVGATSAATAPAWVRQLNTDPRHRIAASLGARIVRANQEALMTSAWNQVGDIEEANRRLRRARLGREASARIVARHIEPLADLGRLGVLAPAFARLALEGPNRTIAGLVADSRLPALSLGASYTALLRPGGRIARRMLPNPKDAPAVAGGIDAGQINPDRGQAGRPGGLVTLEGVLAVVESALASVRGGGVRTPVVTTRIAPTAPGRVRVETRVTGTRTAVTAIRVSDATGMVGSAEPTLTIRGTFSLPAGAAVRRIDPSRLTPGALSELPGTLAIEVGGGGVDVTRAHKLALEALFSPLEPPPARSQTALGIPQVARQALASIDPQKSIVRAVMDRITLPDGLIAADPLDDVLAAPQFPAPLAPDLIRLAPDMLLPGLDEVQPDHVFAVLSNNAFVQALLAGANYEIMRELRWRGFPTDERGTSFHRFWRADADELPDLHRIRTGKLGDAISGGLSDVVVVIRSDLIARFPGTQVFAVPATIGGATARPDFTKPELPLFRGQIAPDVAYYGFGFSEQTATASPGRYLVFQEPLGSASFGLDIDSQVTGFPANARDLAWSHVTMAGDYVRAEQLGPAFLDNGATWGATAADQAASTLQQPMRAAVHFRDLLGAG
jgi:hypothetical protein